MLSDTTASIQLVADHSRLAAGLRAAAEMVNDFGKKVALAPSAAAVGVFKEFGRTIVRGISQRATDFMVQGAQDVFAFERKLTRLGIATRQLPTQLNDIRTAARGLSTEIGIDPVQVLDSYRAYIDLAGAQEGSIEKMKILSRAGQASEAEGKDLAGMMYQLTRSMKVTDAQMEDTMGGLINQAKDGAIEAKQMAAEFAGMMPIFARFGIIGREGAIQLGAMYQVTRDGFDSAAQAQTGMIRLMAGFQRHASRFAKFGVEVFKPGSKKDLRALSDIMEQVKKSPLSKDIESLIKAFGRSEAWRTFELLAEAPARLKALEESGRANGVIQQDLARFTESTAGRLDIALAKVKDGFAKALTPDMVDQIVRGIGSMAEAVPPLMKAIAGVAHGFGRFMHMVARAKNMLQGDSKLKLSDREGALVGALNDEERGKKIHWTPAERNEAKRIRQRQREYNTAIADIMGEEDDFGSTDASIKKAIRLGRAAVMGPHQPGDEAGLAYLEGRKNEISAARYKRLSAEIDAEDEKNMTPYAVSQKRYAQAEAEDRARQEAGTAVLENMKAQAAVIGDAIGKRIGDSIGKLVPKPTVVEVDGNPVAKASSNATDKRRR